MTSPKESAHRDWLMNGFLPVDTLPVNILNYAMWSLGRHRWGISTRPLDVQGDAAHSWRAVLQSLPSQRSGIVFIWCQTTKSKWTGVFSNGVKYSCYHGNQLATIMCLRLMINSKNYTRSFFDLVLLASRLRTPSALLLHPTLCPATHAWIHTVIMSNRCISC